MNKFIAVLLFAACCTQVFGQFFSEEETAKLEKEKQAKLKTDLSEAEQKQIYIELCQAEKKAQDKAIQMHPIKLQQTPKSRADQQAKAAETKEVLMGAYKKEITRKHSITLEYLDRIGATGKEKKWPETAPKTGAAPSTQ